MNRSWNLNNLNKIHSCNLTFITGELINRKGLEDKLYPGKDLVQNKEGFNLQQSNSQRTPITNNR